MTFCHSSSVILATVLSIVMPALFTRMSTRPCWSITSASTRRQSSAWAMLPSCTVIRPPGKSAVMLATNFWDVFVAVPVSGRHVRPRPAKARPMAAPMPRVPPVTNATRPWT